MRLCACRIGQHSSRWTHYFSQWLHGFSGTIAIISTDRYSHLWSNPWSVHGWTSKNPAFAVMLANLPFSLWLLVNTTTAQYCLPAFSFSVSNWVQHSAFLPSGSQAATMWFLGSPKETLWKENLGDPAQVLTANLKPCGWCFLFSAGQCTAFPPGNTEKKGSCYHCLLCQEHPAVPTAGLAPSSMFAKFYWLLTSF